MTRGTPIPLLRSPAEIERLWAGAAPLTPDNAPDWMTPEQSGEYRYVGAATNPVPSDVEQFEASGGMVEGWAAHPGTARLYVARPWWGEVWSIGIYGGPSPLSIAPLPSVSNPVLTRDDVSDVCACFVADPFMVFANNKWHLFFEVMNWRTGRGEIALATSDDAIHWEYRRIVLAEPFHLSYPYVFKQHGHYYMVPETYQAGEVRLYRATEFPVRWSAVATLLRGTYLVDSSPFFHRGSWWMYVDSSPDRQHDTLRLYCAHDLEGPWVEHPSSPLIRGDQTRARPAGRVLEVDGRIIRFAQNCRPAYGTQVRAFEVATLTDSDYGEHPIGPDPLLGPAGAGWNACGMHHVDAHELAPGQWIACVDGWRRTPGLD